MQYGLLLGYSLIQYAVKEKQIKNIKQIKYKNKTNKEYETKTNSIPKSREERTETFKLRLEANKTIN